MAVTPGVFVSCGFMFEREVMMLAPELERLGFDGLTLPDHLLLAQSMDGRYPHSADGKPPFSPDTPWPDALVLIGALSAVTTRLRLMTAVQVLPLRHPLILAKLAATASRLSDGRLTLGVGVGWNSDEFETIGIDFTHRGSIADEAIVVLRKLWARGPTEHSGEHFRIPLGLMEPSPPSIPIVVGGLSDAALRRAAKLGDGYIVPTQSPVGMSDTLERLRRALEREGRSQSSLEVFLPTLGAPPAEILAALTPAVDNIVVMPWPHPGKQVTSVSEKLQHLEAYAADVLTPLREAAAS